MNGDEPVKGKGNIRKNRERGARGKGEDKGEKKVKGVEEREGTGRRREAERTYLIFFPVKEGLGMEGGGEAEGREEEGKGKGQGKGREMGRENGNVDVEYKED